MAQTPDIPTPDVPSTSKGSSGGEIAKDLAKEGLEKGMDSALASNPALSGAVQPIKTAKFLSDKKNRKMIGWLTAGTCGCCIAPLILGIIFGMAFIMSICETYTKYRNNPYLTAVRTVVAPVPTLIADLIADKTFDEYCSGSYSASSSSSYYAGACGDFLQLVQKYLGKREGEMRAIMTAVGLRFNDNLWCADFTSFIVEQMGYDVRDFWYSHTNGWINKFRSGEDGWRLLADGETPQPGDVAMRRDGSHTCMVYNVTGPNSFNCFGGNQGFVRGNRGVTADSPRLMKDFYFGRLPGR